MPPIIAFRCDAASLPEIGTGHVVRDLLLARQIIANGLCRRDELLFITRKENHYKKGYQMILDAGMPIMTVKDDCLIPNSSEEGSILAGTEAKLIIIDRLSTDEMFIKAAKCSGAYVATFDDIGTGALEADLVVNAILDEITDRKQVRSGYQYLILPEHMRHYPIDKHKEINHLVLSPGGYDAKNIIGFTLSAILDYSGLTDIPLKKITCLVGNEDKQVLAAWTELVEKINRNTSVEVDMHIQSMQFHEHLFASDLAVVSGGLTAFECISMGVPIIGLPQYVHQLETFKKLEKNGVAVLASEGMEFNRNYFYFILERMYNDRLQREEMSRKGPLLIDGKGTQRVISELEVLLADKRQLN